MWEDVGIRAFGFVFGNLNDIPHVAYSVQILLGQRQNIGAFGCIVTDVCHGNPHLFKYCRIDGSAVCADEIDILLSRNGLLFFAVDEQI